MKNFFTSYYAKKGLDPLAVSISAKAPPYFKGRWYLKLAPDWEMINGIKHGGWSEEDYTAAYLLKLEDVDPFKVVDDLDDGSVLLCYEISSDFCHRHIAAEWIQQETGIIVREWVEPRKKTIVDDLVEF